MTKGKAAEGGGQHGRETAHAVSAPARLAPLYAAGFVTAFGAHGVAAGLGAGGADIGMNMLRIGILIALYDVAEVILKPIFGSLSDRIGAKPVIVGGLIGFAALSLLGLAAPNAFALAIARLGQGAAAAAFSPASSATVARLAAGRTGRYFGRYGSWKSLGYATGPLVGAGLIAIGGMPLLFAALSVLAAATAVWVLVALPSVPPLPRPRYTVFDLVRQTTDRSFLIPTIALASSTAVLGAAIGFLPALAAQQGSGLFASVAIASVLALSSVLVQPGVGAIRDRGRVRDRAGTAIGLALTAAGVLLAATLAGSPVALYVAAVLIGVGIGTTTPYAFAALADATPPERMGRTMGSAELGREVGDTIGPLLVGGVATIATLSLGLAALGAVTVGAALFVGAGRFLPPSRQ